MLGLINLKVVKKYKIKTVEKNRLESDLLWFLSKIENAAKIRKKTNGRILFETEESLRLVKQ